MIYANSRCPQTANCFGLDGASPKSLTASLRLVYRLWTGVFALFSSTRRTRNNTSVHWVEQRSPNTRNLVGREHLHQVWAEPFSYQQGNNKWMTMTREKPCEMLSHSLRRKWDYYAQPGLKYADTWLLEHLVPKSSAWIWSHNSLHFSERIFGPGCRDLFPVSHECIRDACHFLPGVWVSGLCAGKVF